jgi:subtilase family serine protease
MKLKKAFTCFLTFVFFFSMIGVCPVGAHATASPFLKVGPRAVLTNTTANANPNYNLYSCQVGLWPGVICYDPYQMRHAYNIDNLIKAGFTGKGKTIIIVDAFQSPNIVDQLNYYDTFYGLPSLNGLGGAPDPKLGAFTQVAPDGLTAFDPSDADMIGWAEEISLDVEWAHAIAPGANIVLDLAKSDQDPDILSATKYAVDHNLGDVISQSFGENESCVDSKILKAEHALFEKATTKHITLLASSGDDGAAQLTCDGASYVKAASSPASDPLVTGVGGTELHAAPYCLTALGCDPTANPAPGTYQGEIAWNEPDYGSTGGGFSVLYKAPFFQNLLARGGKQRGVPDVAYSAAVLHGALTYLDIPGPALDGSKDLTGMYLFGGTSAGSPQWAAIMAIADQKAGKRLGFINAALYLYTALLPKYVTLFHDITSGNNSVVEVDSDNNPVAIQGFNAGKGWDATTGLGSPKADQLVNFLIKFTSDNDGALAVQNSAPYNNNGHFGPHRMSH